MTSDLHLFDQAMALRPLDRDLYRGATSPAYWNAISPFGGATAAIVLQAILQHPDRLGDPLAMTINFAGPIRQGEFTVRVSAVRTGRSTQHWQMALFQTGESGAEELALTGTAVFAIRRPAWSDTEARLPEIPPSAALQAFPSPARVPFLERYEMRYPEGQPYTDGEHSRTHCWIADRPPRPVDFLSLVAYCDSFIPRLFVRRMRPSPISTVTMSINFHADGATLDRLEAASALCEARANAFSSGYYDQEGRVWAEDGTLLATTHQLVWYRDDPAS